MALVDLIRVPQTDIDFEQFYWNHLDSHNRIRKAIQGFGGVITSFDIINGGSGYTAIPDISVVGGNGSGVQINISITGGVITSMTVGSGGLQYVNPVVTISGGGGSGAQVTATATPVINLVDYVIYPVRDNIIRDFLENNQHLHTDMNGVLGLQSSDLQDVDFENENQKKAWFYSHYLEHQSAEIALGI